MGVLGNWDYITNISAYLCNKNHQPFPAPNRIPREEPNQIFLYLNTTKVLFHPRPFLSFFLKGHPIWLLFRTTDNFPWYLGITHPLPPQFFYLHSTSYRNALISFDNQKELLGFQNVFFSPNNAFSVPAL